MKTLGEILGEVRTGGKPEYDELRYALCAMESLSVFDGMDLRRNPESNEAIRNMRAEERFRRWKTALNADPKKWLGPANDPDNPEAAMRRKTAMRVSEKWFVKGLPAEHGKEGG